MSRNPRHNYSDVDSLYLDESTSIADWNQLSVGSMCCLRGEVSPGIHNVGSTNPCDLSYWDVSSQKTNSGILQIQPPCKIGIYVKWELDNSMYCAYGGTVS